MQASVDAKSERTFLRRTFTKMGKSRDGLRPSLLKYRSMMQCRQGSIPDALHPADYIGMDEMRTFVTEEDARLRRISKR